MGCGAVCGNNSTITESNKHSFQKLLQLIPSIQHSSLISDHQRNKFIKSIHENPLKYRLIVPEKLSPEARTNPVILEKWKILMFCLDSANNTYCNCLGFMLKKKITRKNEENDDRNEKKSQKPNPNEAKGSGNSEQLLQLEEQIEQQPFIDPPYRHKEFAQIEKDLHRTFDQFSQSPPQHLIAPLEKVLKRITNHFPKMGYTQGINFIVGQLLFFGYSQTEAFWLFCHLALNKRFLALGLFENNFPLYKIYKIIFHNVLKRRNPQLYTHLIDDLKMDEYMWIFIWFNNYFIKSFPSSLITYIFDIVIELGGIGLICFAIAITEELSEILFDGTDVGEISMFLNSLKKVETFNEYVSLKKLMARVYQVDIMKEDFEGIVEQNNSSQQRDFYTLYILESLKEKQGKKQAQFDQPSSHSQSPSNALLNKWYTKLTQEREDFILKNISTVPATQQKPNNHKSENPLPTLKLRDKRTSLQNELQLLIKQQQQQQKLTPISNSNKLNVIIQSNKSESSSYHGSSKPNSNHNEYLQKNITIPSTGYSSHTQNKKNSRILNCHEMASEIDELWDEQNDNESSVSKNISSKLSQQSRTQRGFDINLKKIQTEEEIDKLSSTTQHVNMNKANRTGYSNKSSSIFSIDKQHPNNKSSNSRRANLTNNSNNNLKPKINNFQIKQSSSPSEPNEKLNNLVRAGQQILGNVSINNSSYEDSHSQLSNNNLSGKPSNSNKNYKNNTTKQGNLSNHVTVSKKSVYSGKSNLNHHHHRTDTLNQPHSKDKVNTEESCQHKKIKFNIENDLSDKQSSYLESQNNLPTIYNHHQSKGSVSNDSFQEDSLCHGNTLDIEAQSMRNGGESHRERINTHQDFLVNSMQASQIKNSMQSSDLIENVGDLKNVADSMVSDVEIYQPQQGFKKKNRISSRINDPIENSNSHFNVFSINKAKKLKLNHAISDIEIAHQSNSQLQRNSNLVSMVTQELNYEQSYESILEQSRQSKRP